MAAEVNDKDLSITERVKGMAADLYQVQPYYKRFDQKNNMTRQPYWNPPVIELNRKMNKNLGELVKSNRPGYKLVDWAFYAGAIANWVNNGFNINWPNRWGNSWQPLRKRLETAATDMAKYADYGRLDTDPATATRLVKKVSRYFGADDVGCCLIDRKWVYSHWFDQETKEHYPIVFSDEPGYEKYNEPVQLENRTQVIPKEMKYAVMFLHEMEESGMATAPTLTQFATTMTTYSRISFTTVMVAEFIRGLGYNAIPSSNCTALSVPLAIDAGLGEPGRHGKLITRRFGPRCRISKVITDLPLEVGSPKPWGVTEFCNVCRKCAENCPPGAISMGERSFEPVGIFNHSGVLQWPLDHLKCYEYWSKVGTNCGICIRTCPFNKSAHWSHGVARQFVRRKNSVIDSFMVRMDDLFGYGKFKNPEDFWSE
ncbi:reductive dehalogenase [Chloroflexota bacterium]